MFCKWWSEAYIAAPVTLRRPSIRRGAEPIMLESVMFVSSRSGRQGAEIAHDRLLPEGNLVGVVPIGLGPLHGNGRGFFHVLWGQCCALERTFRFHRPPRLGAD